MKKNLLIMLLLIAVTGLLLAEEPKVKEISLDDLLTNYLPDYEISKQIQLEGIGRDFAVSKLTGDIVIVSKDDNQYIVSMYDVNFNHYWTKEYDGSFKNIIPRISENGETITLFLRIYEGNGKNIIISKSGDELFSITKNAYFIPSPDGNFIYENYFVIDAVETESIYLYDKYGNKITTIVFDDFDVRNIRLRFIDNNHLIVFTIEEGVYMYFCEFHDGSISIINKGIYDYTNVFDVLTSNHHIKIQNNMVGAKILFYGIQMFDMTGNQINEIRNKSIGNYCFTNKGNLFYEDTQNNQIIILQNGLEKKQSLKLSPNFGLFNEAVELNNGLLISTNKNHESNFHSLLITPESIYTIREDFCYLNIDNEEIIITFNYQDSILSIRRNYEN